MRDEADSTALPEPPDTPLELRDRVPALADAAYMNHGAHGPSPRSVVAAADAFVRDHEFDVPATGDPYEAAIAAADDVRQRVAGLVGAAADEIALTESTTAGINAIAGALDWEPGDVVVRTDLEHPAGILPWRRLEREGVEVRVVETTEGRIDIGDFADAVAGAELACFSALTWTHGTRLPVRDLVDAAHEAGALALVDAVQVPGQLPMNVHEWGADAVAAAGHKWLLGLWGGGFLYVNDAVADRFQPRTVGYRSVVEPTAGDLQFEPGARRFEVGSANPGPHVALGRAVEVVQHVGVESVADRILRLARRLAEGVPDDRLLSPRSPESGLVTVDVPDPAATVERLRDRGIVLRALPYPDAIRASIHAVNTEAEVDQLLETLEAEWD